jgi:hypothetical protein
MATLEERINNLTGEITGRTKGPISNKEMEMFNQATGNVNSTPNLLKQKVARLMKEANFLKSVGAISDREMEIFMQSGSINDAQEYLTNLKGRLPSDTDIAKGAISNREMEMFNNAMPSRAMPSRAMPPMSPMAQGGIMAFANGGEAMAPQMSNEQGMAEIEMSKEQAMQEIFIPLAENGYEQEVMAILNNPIDSEISMQAQQVLAQVLSQDPEFDMEDFQMAISLVAPQ